MEVKDRVVLTADDIKMVEDFFQHYNDPKTNNLIMPEKLTQEIEKFKEKSKTHSYTVEDQRLFSIAISEALHKTTHPLLKDPAIADVISACSEVWTDAQFYEEFEKTLATPQTGEED